MLCLSYAYFISLLEIKAEQVLPGSKVGKEGEEGGGGHGGEMTQTMYACVNK
jgi:hypothetical protein